MVIEQCPQCGYEPIQHEVRCTIPPVSVERCPKCGWRHEERDTLQRVVAGNKQMSRPPKKHGRLIDADKLKQHYAWWGEDSEQKKLFDQIIDLQPTVVEQEE